MYLRGKGNCQSGSRLNTLWHISNGYRNEWTSRSHCNEMNWYATQKGLNFEAVKNGIKAFLRINFIMSINKLPSLEDYWSTDKCIRNRVIQNMMTRISFQSILQTFHFSNNDNYDKTDKSYKIHPFIEHRNKLFAESLPSNSPFQSVDEHMC